MNMENNPVPSTPPVPPTAAPAAPEAPGNPKPLIQYDDFAKIDLRVATVLACEAHPKADKLLKLQVDLGPLGTRQICAGVRAYYQPEELVGRQIVVVANLAPRMLRGEESRGMLLAASHEQGPELRDVVLLAPGKIVPPGSPIS